MKIYIPNVQEGKIGGGWTFVRNFTELAGQDLTNGLAEADIFFITSPTLVKRDDAKVAKEFGQKIVLRVDGVPEDWRNRGTGWPRLRDYVEIADEVIYQSDFIKETVGRLLGRSGRVIYNGVDTSVFSLKLTDGVPMLDSIIYVNYRKAEQNKRVEEAIERFRYFKLDNPDATITFVGLFPKNIREWDFWMLDFEKRKDWKYWGVAHTPLEMAAFMKAHEYIAFPSFADPCPNTLIEALSCGCTPLWINDYGSSVDIVRMFREKYDFSRERMVKEYLEVFREVLA